MQDNAIQSKKRQQIRYTCSSILKIIKIVYINKLLKSDIYQNKLILNLKIYILNKKKRSVNTKKNNIGKEYKKHYLISFIVKLNL